jgi:hypothetical protein
LDCIVKKIKEIYVTPDALMNKIKESAPDNFNAANLITYIDFIGEELDKIYRDCAYTSPPIYISNTSPPIYISNTTPPGIDISYDTLVSETNAPRKRSKNIYIFVLLGVLFLIGIIYIIYKIMDKKDQSNNVDETVAVVEAVDNTEATI